jgi:hypothetical protein
MAYQNINQYVFKKWYLKPIYTSFDMSLASDERDYNEEVVFSNEVIGYYDGNVLPINIDLNYSGSNQQLTLTYGNYNYNNIVVSSNFYNGLNLDLSLFTASTICDIGLTGIDNGLVTGMTGQSITVTNGLDNTQTFSRNFFDRRFKMFQITGYTSPPNNRFSGSSAQTLYEMVSYSGNNVGYYVELYGGFYQGFYKLFGYDYDIMPERMNRGWTMEMVLKPRLFNVFQNSYTSTTLNNLYPDNQNIFFFFGTRAENKFYHHASGTPLSDSGYTRVTESLSDCLKTCACADTGVTNSRCIDVYEPSAVTVTHNVNCNCGCNNSTITDIPDKDPLWDGMSNAIAIKLCGDPTNPKIGVRVFSFTGDCITTGTTPNTGITYNTGYTITDYCSTDGIYDYCLSNTAFTYTEHWFLIDVVWERNTWLDTCDLYYRGGLGLITDYVYLDSLANNSVALIEPPITSGDEIPVQLDIVKLNERWLIEKNYRKGKLKIYVNGRLFYTIDDFEEIIPRALDTDKERQIGVPFNISWGGGTLGLHENLTFSACPTGTTNYYIQDPECFPNEVLSGTSLSGLSTNIFLENNFGGTFDGAISQFRFYVDNLDSSKIRHNFNILKTKFSMFDPSCPSCYVEPVPSLTPTPTQTPTVTPTNTVTPTPTITPTATLPSIAGAFRDCCTGNEFYLSTIPVQYNPLIPGQIFYVESSGFSGCVENIASTISSVAYVTLNISGETNCRVCKTNHSIICPSPTPTPTNTPTPTSTSTVITGLTCTTFAKLPQLNESVTYFGTTITATGSGDVQVLGNSGVDFQCQLGVFCDANTAMLGRGTNVCISSPFSYTLNFSSPVNNITIRLINFSYVGYCSYGEYFTLTTNVGNPTISADIICCGYIQNNSIYTELCDPALPSPYDGGGVFLISAPSPFTSLTIDGNGGGAGTAIDICLNTLPSITPTPTPTPGLPPTPTPTNIGIYTVFMTFDVF